MLQAIRSKASSFVVKLLFGILVVSFGIWGIGDIFRNRAVDTAVATVGGKKIDAQELNQEVRREAERLRAAMRGAQLEPEQLKQFGIVDTSLQRLINRDLIDLEIDHLQLALSDDAVRQAIIANPAFHNQTGQFDRILYKQLIANQRMSETQFERQLRDDMVRVELNAAIGDGVTAPPELVDTLYKSRAERRVAEVAVVPTTAVPEPGTPSDTDIAKAYEQHQDQFRVPELRSFNAALLLLDDIAAGITVPDEKLREEYQNRIAEFHTPEQRHLQQILLSDEAKAKEAEAALAAGKDFAQVAQEVAGATPESLDLGFATREEMPPALGDAAFALKPGETTNPIEDSFGWHIVRIVEVKPEETQPFEAVKEKLVKEVARDMAGDQLAKLANQVDDAVAGGTPFAEIIQRFGLKVSKLENIDAGGRNADGKPVELPQGGDAILRTAFTTASGQTSQLNELGESGYYMVQVEKVTPSAVKPLDEVREQVVVLWQQETRDAALASLSKEIAGEVGEGKSLADLAKTRAFQTFTTKPLPRSGGDPKVPPVLVARLFEAKTGGVVSAKGDDGYLVAQLKETLPPDPTTQTAGTARLSQQLGAQMQDDLLREYDQALRDRYPVSIDQAAVARAF
ncbi:MAG TPA: peptidyl-prolyl cis-trans isomerase [Stellaceae bacterium]|nr:peptidyl-prolyl cis-trans isomerase [Stellaceae bacterium]